MDTTEKREGPEPSAPLIAWAAGLFEGEGCLNNYPRGKKRGVQMRLGMTDRDVVGRFAEIVGCGNVHRVPRAHRGEQDIWQWCVYEAKEVSRLIEMFLPWLGQRRRAKAEEVLAIAQDIALHNKVKTHCPRGHELAGDNLITEPIRGGKYLARRCRQCRRQQERERMRRKLGTKPEHYRVREAS